MHVDGDGMDKCNRPSGGVKVKSELDEGHVFAITRLKRASGNRPYTFTHP